MAAYDELKKESAPGIDEQTVKEYFNGIEEKIKKLLELAKSGKYKAPPVKRVEIPKPGSKETPTYKSSSLNISGSKAII